MENDEFCQAMQSLGVNFVPDANTLKRAEKAICYLYNSPEYNNTNIVRSNKWNKQTTDITKLPPCHDSAILHIKRENYQAALWRRCLENDMGAPLPHGHGWAIDQNGLSIVWMTQPRAPKKLLELVKCCCKSNTPCSTSKCSCRRQGLPCILKCMCNKECCNDRLGATVENGDNDI